MKTRKRKVSNISRESIKKFFFNADRSSRLGYFRSARYTAVLFCAILIGCALSPGMPFESVTVVRNEIRPGCYRNIGNWIKTDYPNDWQIDYGWDPVNAEIEPRCQK